MELPPFLAGSPVVGRLGQRTQPLKSRGCCGQTDRKGNGTPVITTYSRLGAADDRRTGAVSNRYLIAAQGGDA